MVLDALSIGVGQNVLDLGCGGGHMVRELALAVGSDGRAVGFDLNADQLVAARALCNGLEAAEFVEGDAQEMPFEDDDFHGVTSVQVLEYIPDPDRALSETRRVLRPGGRVAFISTLWDHFQYHGAEPGLTGQMLDAFRAHCPHQLLPLEMPARLAEAGFGGVARRANTIFNGACHENSYGYWAAQIVAAFGVAKGIAEDDAKSWLDQLAKADSEGRYAFVSVQVLTEATAI
jgi:ubiquinone/menaquinone biosynthesis C-methylase UbiE